MRDANGRKRGWASGVDETIKYETDFLAPTPMIWQLNVMKFSCFSSFFFSFLRSSSMLLSSFDLSKQFFVGLSVFFSFYSSEFISCSWFVRLSWIYFYVQCGYTKKGTRETRKTIIFFLLFIVFKYAISDVTRMKQLNVLCYVVLVDGEKKKKKTLRAVLLLRDCLLSELQYNTKVKKNDVMTLRYTIFYSVSLLFQSH